MSEVPKALKNINLKAILRDRGIFEQLEENRKLKESLKPLAKSMAKKPVVIPEVQISKSFTNDQITEYVNKRVHTIQVVEARLENKLKQYIEFIGKGFIRNLDNEISNKNFAEFVKKDYFSDNEDEFLTKAQIDFTPLLENIAVIAGNDANKFIGIKDPYLPFNYRDKIVKNVDRFTKSMLDTDRQHLVDVISEGLKEGKTNNEIRDIIEADFSDYTKNQATRITTTEVARASQQAAVDAYQQSDIVEGLQWIIFGADDECADYDGEVRSLDDSGFYDVENEFQDGDPPLHPNCKCQLIPIVIGTQPTYEPNKQALIDKIRELEANIDKRTKAFKKFKSEAKAKELDDKAYIESLHKYLGVSDES